MTSWYVVCGSIGVRYCVVREMASETVFYSKLLNVVRKIPFKIYKVTSGFNPTSAFSQVNLNLDEYKKLKMTGIPK